MALTIVTDSIRIVRAIEVGGVITNATTALIVIAESGDFVGAADDMTTILDTIDDPVNTSLSAFAAGGTFSAKNPQLFVVSREVVNDGDPLRYEVIVNYQWFNTHINQSNAGLNLVIPRHELGLQSVTTDRIPDTGAPAIVTHNNEKQVAEFSTQEPRISYVFDIVLATNNPDKVSETYISSINKADWKYQEDKFLWLCTNASYRNLSQADTGGITPQFIFTLAFEFSPSGHQPRAQWIDRRTTRAPAQLEDEVGEFEVNWFLPIDFNIEPIANSGA